MKRSILVVVSVLAVLIAQGASTFAEPESKPVEPTPVEMPGLKAGDVAPDAQIARANGDPVQLGDLYKRGPIVLVFYRGGWCPFCIKNLSAWEGRLAKISSYGATIIAVSPDGPQGIEKTVTDQKLRYEVVSDYKGEAASMFGIAFEMPEPMQEKYKGYGVDLSKRNWNGSWTLPHPAVYVIDREAKIRYAYCNEDYQVRADPEEAIRVLEQMVKEQNEALKKK